MQDQNSKTLKANDQIQYKLNNSNEWIKATVLGRAGKVTGKNKNWYNVQETESEKQNSVDLGQLQQEKIEKNHDTENADIVLKAEAQSDEYTVAKESELQKLKQVDTYEEVKDSGQCTLLTRCVINNKNGVTKARLVVRGFEEKYLMQKGSPTAGKEALRIFLGIASNQNWTVKTTDIMSTFLQGKELKKDIYLKPPKESNTPEGIIWKLKHCLYGLKDGA